MSNWSYEALIPKGAGHRSFLLQVNPEGEAVMYRVGENGQPEDFAVGTVEDVLAPVLRGRWPFLIVREWPEGFRGHPFSGGLDNPMNWRLLGANTAWWEEIARALNGKGKKAGEMLKALEFYGLARQPLKDYVRYEDGRWVATPKAVQIDEQRKKTA